MMASTENDDDVTDSYYVDPIISSLKIEDILLNGPPEGEAIIDYFKKKKRFKQGNKTRSKIGYLITQYIITKKNKYTEYDKIQLAKKTAAIFEGEDSSFWYVPAEKGGPKGYFNNSIRNQRHRLKREREVTPEPEEIEQIDEEILNEIQFLKEHIDCLPKKQFTIAWNKTRVLRRNDLNKIINNEKEMIKKIRKTKTNERDQLCLYSVEEFLNKWTNFKSDYGPELIIMDFNAWYPSADQFSEKKIDKLIKNIMNLRKLKKEKKWQLEINNLETIINNKNLNKNSQFIAKLRLLPFMVPPHGRFTPAKKISVIDCQKSIVILEKDITEIKNVVSKRAEELKKQHSTLQPMMIAIGNDWKEITDIYICINDTFWQMNNVVKAFDVLFKSFFVFETSFPKESIELWGIIQKIIYKINTPIDPLASGIVTDLIKNTLVNEDIEEIDTDNVVINENETDEIVDDLIDKNINNEAETNKIIETENNNNLSNENKENSGNNIKKINDNEKNKEQKKNKENCSDNN